MDWLQYIAVLLGGAGGSVGPGLGVGPSSKQWEISSCDRIQPRLQPRKEPSLTHLFHFTSQIFAYNGT